MAALVDFHPSDRRRPAIKTLMRNAVSAGAKPRARSVCASRNRDRRSTMARGVEAEWGWWGKRDITGAVFLELATRGTGKAVLPSGGTAGTGIFEHACAHGGVPRPWRGLAFFEFE